VREGEFEGRRQDLIVIPTQESVASGMLYGCLTSANFREKRGLVIRADELEVTIRVPEGQEYEEVKAWVKKKGSERSLIIRIT